MAAQPALAWKERGWVAAEAMRLRVSSHLARRIVRTGAGCVLALAMIGCAIVEERHADGSVDRSIVVGPAILQQPPPSRGAVIKTSGLGLAVANGATSLGLFDNSVVALEPGCHVVLIGNTDEQLRKFTELTGGARDVCDANVDGGGKK